MSNSTSLFFFSFFIFFLLLCVHFFLVQEASCSPSYGKNKTYKLNQTTKETTLVKTPQQSERLRPNILPILLYKNTYKGKNNKKRNYLPLPGARMFFLQSSVVHFYKKHKAIKRLSKGRKHCCSEEGKRKEAFWVGPQSVW